jgi:hypothetical protein
MAQDGKGSTSSLGYASEELNEVDDRLPAPLIGVGLLLGVVFGVVLVAGFFAIISWSFWSQWP